MSFEAASRAPEAEQDKDIIDFSVRAHLSEMMDEPCSYEELRDCLRDLSQVNRVTFAHRPTLQWLQQFANSSSASRPLHIVDVGCGGGDMLRRIERWAMRRRMVVRLTGIDLNPHAIRAAREFTPQESRIQWVTGMAQSFDAASDLVDLVISSLFTHHLHDDEIAAFLAWMESVARRGWFINDLYRSRNAYRAFGILSAIMRWHPFVRHDGPVSIRRAFRQNDWKKYLTASELSPDAASIETHWPARLCVGRIKSQ
ncbi:methyltransferase domain-containing protein [Acidobacterium sp. S8]|uniref:methyltransferase domain-containing protein n=1 Tax=Acidobacterium sp. S8 TaxID=1641854 RepID=UPI0020B15C1C|nr:methyltransferase domain-containing protein [Acidobacterium sp. S8]